MHFEGNYNILLRKAKFSLLLIRLYQSWPMCEMYENWLKTYIFKTIVSKLYNSLIGTWVNGKVDTRKIAWNQAIFCILGTILSLSNHRMLTWDWCFAPPCTLFGKMGGSLTARCPFRLGLWYENLLSIDCLKPLYRKFQINALLFGSGKILINNSLLWQINGIC